jgi:hypothetical protein
MSIWYSIGVNEIGTFKKGFIQRLPGAIVEAINSLLKVVNKYSEY